MELSRGDVTLEIRRLRRLAGALLSDVVFTPADSEPVSAYLVRPRRIGVHAGVVYLHWLGPTTSDRTHFLSEAITMAQERNQVSLLPDLWFPFQTRPTGGPADLENVRRQVSDVVAALDLLRIIEGVDPSRTALVGHDYGGMFGLVAAAHDALLRGLVAVAVDATFSHWFLDYFLDLEPGDAAAYDRLLSPADPQSHLPLRTSLSVLLQIATHDDFVPDLVGWHLSKLLGPSGRTRVYEDDHQLSVARARHDRIAFLDGLFSA